MWKVEKNIYEWLGVKVFRYLVFKLEKLIHRKDKGRNINYHIAAYDFISLNDFIKYLFYNGFIHVRNVLFLMIIFLVRYIILQKEITLFDIVLWVMFLKDCYCIMLQRYNYICIQIRNKQMKEKYQERVKKKTTQILDTRQVMLNEDEIKDCLAFLHSLNNSIVTKKSIVIEEGDILYLQILTRILKDSDKSRKER